MSLTWTSRIGDLFGPGDGKVHTYTAANYDFNNEVKGGSSVIRDETVPLAEREIVATSASNVSLIASSKDPAKFVNPGLLFGFNSAAGQAMFPGTYVVGSSTGTQKEGSTTAAASIHLTPVLGHCNSDETAGFYKIVSASYELVFVPDVHGIIKGFWEIHALTLQMHFELRCTANDGVFVGDFRLTNKPTPGAVPLGSLSIGPGTGGGSGSGSGGPPQGTPSGPVVVLPDSAFAGPLVMANSSATTLPLSTFIPDTVTGDVTLSTTTDAPDLTASVSPSVIPLGGSGDAVLTIHTTATTSAGDHAVTVTASADGVTSSSATVFVTVICDPPFILGIDQPKSSTVSPGRPAILSVTASGSGPFSYQWFTGSSGLVNFPLAGGSTPNFTTSALNDTTSYWVRVTNPCGSTDSQTATITVSPGAKGNSRR